MSNNQLTPNNWLEFLKNERFLSLIKDSMKDMRSSAAIKFHYNPKITYDEVIKRFKGWDEKVRAHTSHGTSTFMFSKDKKMMTTTLETGYVSIQIYSTDSDAEKDRDELLKNLEDIKFEQKDPRGVWAEFAYYTDDGPQKTNRFLQCPEWDAIHDNYPRKTQEAVSTLMGMSDPTKYGRLVVWNGEPGTGKTYAIRALMMAWRNRYNFVIITDPERFAAEPGYYLQTASPEQADDGDDDPYLAPMEMAQQINPPPADKGHNTLFILEDAADLVLESSRDSRSETVGRLLNMTDGLFGQGRKDLFMVTFNEALAKIDKAFLRPGRCIMSHIFPLMPQKESEGWLRKKGADSSVDKEMSLADLYERHLRKELTEIRVSKEEKVAGFGIKR